jgi:hypothetical protein
MSKNTIKNCHLTYAAVHQSEKSYNKAVLTVNIFTIVKISIVGFLIKTSSPEFIPILNNLITNM